MGVWGELNGKDKRVLCAVKRINMRLAEARVLDIMRELPGLSIKQIESSTKRLRLEGYIEWLYGGDENFVRGHNVVTEKGDKLIDTLDDRYFEEAS